MKKYTEEQLIEAVKTSFSYRQVLVKLGVEPYGGNYSVLKNNIRKLNIDVSHMTGQGHLKGKNHNYNTRPIAELLVENSIYQSFKLKNRLLKEGLKEHKCEMCGITEWMSKPTPLELDHMNGNNKDNRLENLRVICPNCHAQTETYRGKNKKS
jgi:Zn finger protein HypA/HybF involved in hydrogenase expression